MLLRAAEPDDAVGVAQVHVRSWRVGYRNLLPDAYLDSLRAEDRVRRYTFGSADQRDPATIVAVESGIIRGFATTAPASDPDAPGQGELCALYVDPDWWAQGIGAALESAARAQLISRGFHNAILWLLTGNARGERFYRTQGWTPDGVRRTATVWGVTVDEMRFRRTLTLI